MRQYLKAVQCENGSVVVKTDDFPKLELLRGRLASRPECVSGWKGRISEVYDTFIVPADTMAGWNGPVNFCKTPPEYALVIPSPMAVRLKSLGVQVQPGVWVNGPDGFRQIETRVFESDERIETATVKEAESIGYRVSASYPLAARASSKNRTEEELSGATIVRPKSESEYESERRHSEEIHRLLVSQEAIELLKLWFTEDQLKQAISRRQAALTLRNRWREARELANELHPGLDEEMQDAESKIGALHSEIKHLERLLLQAESGNLLQAKYGKQDPNKPITETLSRQCSSDTLDEVQELIKAGIEAKVTELNRVQGDFAALSAIISAQFEFLRKEAEETSRKRDTREASNRWRERRIAEIGLEAYRKEIAENQKRYRARKRALKATA